MLYSFFWVIPRRLNFIYRRFGTLFSNFIGGVSRKNNRDEIVGVFMGKRFGSTINTPTVSPRLFFLFKPPMKMEQKKCSETSEYKIQTSGNYPKERTQHSEHGGSLKSRFLLFSGTFHRNNPPDRDHFEGYSSRLSKIECVRTNTVRIKQKISVRPASSSAIVEEKENVWRKCFYNLANRPYIKTNLEGKEWRDLHFWNGDTLAKKKKLCCFAQMFELFAHCLHMQIQANAI